MMRLIDLYYRAFSMFRKHTSQNSISLKERKIISYANQKDDVLTAIKHICEIDSDWIENIEEGLIYVERAILEDRQFIRTEGNVVPIDKVKKTSKATVEHLARHSDFITRVPKNKKDPIIPDKLYIVEKLSDYAVYENRFLYMLLCYLKDFIKIRLDKIRDKVTTYQAEMFINKEIKTNDRHIDYKLDYKALNKSDPYLTDQFRQIPLVVRMENIYALVNSFLGTHLMKEVSKSPMIKPPIVKTNVLLMNQNFRAAVALYEYVSSYTKDGYTFKEIKKTYNPFSVEMTDEMADIIELTNSISYGYGQNIMDVLKKNYEAEEERLKEIEDKKQKADLKRLKKILFELGEDPTEYILNLEKHLKSLEKENAKYVIEKEKNSQLKLQINQLESDKEILINNNLELVQNLQIKQEELEVFKQKYFDDLKEVERIHFEEMTHLTNKKDAEIKKIIAQHEAQIRSLITKHELELTNLINKTNEQIKALKEDYETKITKLIEDTENEINTLINSHNQSIRLLEEEKEKELQLVEEKHNQIINHQKELYEHQLKSLQDKNEDLTKNVNTIKLSLSNQIHEYKEAKTEHEKQVVDFTKKIKHLENEKRYQSAQHHAFKQQQGLITEEDDFTAKDKFKQLELERQAYKKFFKEQWKKTKQAIRSEIKNKLNNGKPSEDSVTKDKDI